MDPIDRFIMRAFAVIVGAGLASATIWGWIALGKWMLG